MLGKLRISIQTGIQDLARPRNRDAAGTPPTANCWLTGQLGKEKELESAHRNKSVQFLELVVLCFWRRMTVWLPMTIT